MGLVVTCDPTCYFCPLEENVSHLGPDWNEGMENIGMEKKCRKGR